MPEREIEQHWIAKGICLFLLALYVLTYSGRIHVVDEAYLLAATESFSKGRLDTNQVALCNGALPK